MSRLMMPVPHLLDVADDAIPDAVQTLELIDDNRQFMVFAVDKQFLQQDGKGGRLPMNVQCSPNTCSTCFPDMARISFQWKPFPKMKPETPL